MSSELEVTALAHFDRSSRRAVAQVEDVMPPIILNMEALTLDQIQLFLAVVDEGSFTVAAKQLNRARSAVTYGSRNSRPKSVCRSSRAMVAPPFLGDVERMIHHRHG